MTLTTVVSAYMIISPLCGDYCFLPAGGITVDMDAQDTMLTSAPTSTADGGNWCWRRHEASHMIFESSKRLALIGHAGQRRARWFNWLMIDSQRCNHSSKIEIGQIWSIWRHGIWQTVIYTCLAVPQVASWEGRVRSSPHGSCAYDDSVPDCHLQWSTGALNLSSIGMQAESETMLLYVEGTDRSCFSTETSKHRWAPHHVCFNRQA